MSNSREDADRDDANEAEDPGCARPQAEDHPSIVRVIDLIDEVEACSVTACDVVSGKLATAAKAAGQTAQNDGPPHDGPDTGQPGHRRCRIEQTATPPRPAPGRWQRRDA